MAITAKTAFIVYGTICAIDVIVKRVLITEYMAPEGYLSVLNGMILQNLENGHWQTDMRTHYLSIASIMMGLMRHGTADGSIKGFRL